MDSRHTKRLVDNAAAGDVQALDHLFARCEGRLRRLLALKAGSAVEIAGVEIGRVESIGLADYQARVTLRVHSGVKLQEDVIASIKTKGLIGEKYIRISPGGSDKIIAPNGRIREVEAPVDFEELLSKYIFGKV